MGAPHAPLRRQPVPRRRSARKHTGFGIASFILAIAAGLAEFTVMVGGAVIASSNRNDVAERSPLAIGLALSVCGASVAAVTGVALGVAGLCQSRRKTTFAVLGLVLNGLVLLCVLFWMVVGALNG
jgi:hypothetical protein